MPEAQRRNTLKTVLSGAGYKEGEKISVGASRKGRIWSHHRGRVDQLAAWCNKIGAKLLDEKINTDEVLKGTLEAQTVSKRPEKMPISIDWPETIYTCPEGFWSFLIGEQMYQLSELSLEIVSSSVDGKLRFAIASETEQIELELRLIEVEEIPNYRFVNLGDRNIQIRRGERAEGNNVTDFFYNDPPVIWFSDGSSLEGNQYVELKNTYPPYDVNKIEAWDWTDIDIEIKEPQGVEKDPNSVQAKAIRELKVRNYHVIVDDHGKGEAADIVAIRLDGDTAAPSCIDVEFYHCKKSLEPTPGSRIDDLYDVCGQAQKSIIWMSSPEKKTDLFTHLLRRESLRQRAGTSSRYETGDEELLLTIREMSRLCPVSLKIYILSNPASQKTKPHATNWNL